MDQSKVDAWREGRVSVGESVDALLREHFLLAKSSKWMILRWIDGLTADGIFRWLREQRPDLELGEERATVDRIERDLRDVRKRVEEL